MALIDGGKISEGAWLKVIAALLGVNIALGGWVGARAINTLDTVSSAVIRHEADIVNMKEEIKFIRGNKSRSEVLPGDLGNPPFRFRGRGPSGPKADVPRPPTEPPQTDGPPEPKPKPQPRQERPADADTNRRDKILPVQE
jgi:hypothetical protein